MQTASAAQVLAAPQALSPEAICVLTATGEDILHSIYSVIECPELKACTFVLTDRSTTGPASILLGGDLDDAAPSLNQATLRRLSANLDVPLASIDVHIYRSFRQPRPH